MAKLLEECRNQDYFREPEFIIADFEKVVHNAVGDISLDEVQILSFLFRV